MAELMIVNSMEDLRNIPQVYRKYIIFSQEKKWKESVKEENLITKKDLSEDKNSLNLKSLSKKALKNAVIIGSGQATSYVAGLAMSIVVDHFKNKIFPPGTVIVNSLGDGGFKFPISHPIYNVPYVLNPVNETSYHLLYNFHNDLFQEKAIELVRLLRHLGAKTINVTHIEGMSIGGGMSSDSTVASTQIGINSIGNKKISWSSEYPRPSQPSKIPDKLGWYYSESRWQEIAEGRMESNLEKFDVLLDYRSDFGVNLEISSKFKKALKLSGEFSYATQSISQVSGEFWPKDL